MSNHKIEAVWSGSYPALCYGEWSLTIDGKDFTRVIPKKRRSEPMGTFKTYSHWQFGEDWDEEWEDYEDGMGLDEWVQSNMSWIQKLPIENSDYESLYEAFRAQDFRHGECGGCI